MDDELDGGSVGLDILLDRLDDGYVRFDVDGAVVDANVVARDLLGMPTPVAEASGSAIPDGLREIVEDLSPGERRETAIRAGDDGRDLEMDAWRPEWMDGALVLLSTVDEHADRGRTLEWYRRVVEAMGDGLYVLDADGTFVETNEYLLDLSGYDREEIRGVEPSKILEDEDIRRFQEAIEELLAEGGEGTKTVEAALETADGAAVPIEANLTLLPSPGGEFRGTVGVVRDITDRKERERELEQYETIIETVPDGVFVIDEDGDIVGGNTNAARMYGYDERMDGESFLRLVEDGVYDEEIIDVYFDHVGDLLSSSTDTDRARFEYEVTLDGETRYMETHLTLRPYDEEFRGVIGVTRDVTERREREREIERQNERLEEFASVVSHDLRNPLNVISGHLDLARETGDEVHFEAMERGVDRMATLIEDLLSLARKGRMVGETEPLSLGAVAREAWATVESPDATMAVVDDGTIDADRDRLDELLGNLFRNAIEHAGEAVTVRVGTVPDGFYVEDDGPGIPPGDRKEVFERGVTTSADGTGFGLAIVEDIAEAHGWSVDLVSGREGGARFEFDTATARADGDGSEDDSDAG